jgi:hypothetical protein
MNSRIARFKLSRDRPEHSFAAIAVDGLPAWGTEFRFCDISREASRSKARPGRPADASAEI